MPFSSNNNVEITIRVDDRDSTKKLESLEKTLAAVGLVLQKELKEGFKQSASSLDNLGNSAKDADRGFSSFQAGIVAVNQGLQLSQTVFRAASGAARELFDALGEAQRIEGLTRAFDNLQGSIGRIGGDSLDELRTATRGLVSDLELFEAANNAVLLGVDRGTGEFDELAAAAVKLGQATGRTATEALNDLTTGIGRQSRLILDNLGIIVDTTAAYENFAEANGKLAKDLTEAEKKIAFQTEALAQATTKASELAEVQETAGTATQRLGAQFENLRAEFLTTLSDNTELNQALGELSVTLSSIDVAAFATDLAQIAAGFISIADAIIGVAQPALEGFKTTIDTIAAISITPLSGSIFDGLQNVKDLEITEATLQLETDIERLKAALSEDLSISDLGPLSEQLKELESDFGNLSVKVPGTAKEIVAIRTEFQELKTFLEGGGGTAEYNRRLEAARERLRALGDSSKKTGTELSKAFEGASKAADGFLASLGAAEENPFVDVFRGLVESQQEAGASTEELRTALRELARGFSTTKANAKDVEDALKILTKEEEEAAKAAAELEKAFDEAFDFEGATRAIGPLTEVNSIIEDLADSSRLSEEEVEKLRARLRELKDAGLASKEELEKLGKVLEKNQEQAKGFGDALSGVITGLQNLTGLELGGLTDILNTDVGKAIGQDIASGIADAIRGEDFSEVFASVSESVGGDIGREVGNQIAPGLGDIIGSAIGEKIGKEIGEIGQSTSDTLEGLDFLLPTFTLGLGSVLDSVFGGQREDPFRDARKGLASFLDELDEAAGTDFFGDFLVEGFSEVVKSLEEVQDIFGDTFEDFTTQLDDGTFLVNEFSAQLGELGLTADRDLLATFEGIGTAIASTFEDAEGNVAAFGQQFGTLLGINLEDGLGLNQLQLALEASGASAEVLGKALEDAFFSGEISAKQFLNAADKTENLFEQGIPGAVGAVDAAFANLASGGLQSGQQALDAFGDLGAEAAELGISGFSGLRDAITATGVSIEDATSLLDSLRDADITTVDEIIAVGGNNLDELQSNLSSAGVEAGEVALLFQTLSNAGINTTEALAALSTDGLALLGDALLQSGVSLEEVTKLLDAVRNSGIGTVEALQNINLNQSATIVSNLEDVSFGFAEVSDEINTARELLERFRRETSQPITQQVNVNFSLTGDPDAIAAGQTASLTGQDEPGPRDFDPFAGQNINE